MLGLTLGVSLDCVRSLLGTDGNIIALPHSPKLIVDYKNEQLAFLRAKEMMNCHYDWQNIMARMMFEGGALVGMMVHGSVGDEAYTYKGKLFGKVGLGSPISELQDFGRFEYDDVEEVFYSGQWIGIEIGGAGACDLSVDPSQHVTSFKVFRVK